MQLLSLYLRDFRNYKEAYVEFSPHLNEICGANAQGKTNLLEAIFLLVIGRSFRTMHLKELIKLQQPSFFVEAAFVKHGVSQTLQVSYDGTEKRAVHNSTVYSSFAPLLGLLQGVVFSPEDHDLISGAPSTRRRFLDLHIAQIDPLYVHHLGRFYRAMRQRNQLLRTKTALTIEAWEHEMAKAAAYITKQRALVIDELNEKILPLQEEISSSKDRLKLRFKTPAPLTASSDDLAHFYSEALARHRSREMLFGNTLVGPHRDDFIPLLHEQEARVFGSEGQKMSCALALRLAEWQRLKETTGETPLMIVDDVGACLDEQRRQKLYEQLNLAGQVFTASPQRLCYASQNVSGRLFYVSDAVIDTVPAATPLVS